MGVKRDIEGEKREGGSESYWGSRGSPPSRCVLFFIIMSGLLFLFVDPFRRPSGFRKNLQFGG